MGAEGSRPCQAGGDQPFTAALRHTRSLKYIAICHETPEQLADFGPVYLPTSKLTLKGDCYIVPRSLLIASFKKTVSNVLVKHNGERIPLHSSPPLTDSSNTGIDHCTSYFLLDPKLSYYCTCLGEGGREGLRRARALLASLDKDRLHHQKMLQEKKIMKNGVAGLKQSRKNSNSKAEELNVPLYNASRRASSMGKRKSIAFNALGVNPFTRKASDGGSKWSQEQNSRLESIADIGPEDDKNLDKHASGFVNPMRDARTSGALAFTHSQSVPRLIATVSDTNSPGGQRQSRKHSLDGRRHSRRQSIASNSVGLSSDFRKRRSNVFKFEDDGPASVSALQNETSKNTNTATVRGVPSGMRTPLSGDYHPDPVYGIDAGAGERPGSGSAGSVGVTAENQLVRSVVQRHFMFEGIVDEVCSAMRKEVFATGDAVIDVGELQSKFYVVEKGHLMVEEGFSIHELMDKYTNSSALSMKSILDTGKKSDDEIDSRGQSEQKQQEIARSRVTSRGDGTLDEAKKAVAAVTKLRAGKINSRRISAPAMHISPQFMNLSLGSKQGETMTADNQDTGETAGPSLAGGGPVKLDGLSSVLKSEFSHTILARVLLPTHYLGEDSLILDVQAEATVRVIEPSVLWSLDGHVYQQLRKAKARKDKARREKIAAQKAEEARRVGAIASSTAAQLALTAVGEVQGEVEKIVAETERIHQEWKEAEDLKRTEEERERERKRIEEEEQKSMQEREEQERKENEDAARERNVTAASSDGANDEIEYKMEDLKQVAMVGAGSFGAVRLVVHEPTSTPMALKVLSKAFVVELNQQKQVCMERDAMRRMNHSSVCRLYGTLQDANCLYMLLEYLPGGELYQLVYSESSTLVMETDGLSEAAARFYTANILLALEHMHQRSFIYRDLKLENIVLDEKGYPKLVDFGFAKALNEYGERTFTRCGSPDYMAPEAQLAKGHDHGVDIWALGVLITELLVGKSPFYDSNPLRIAKKVQKVTKDNPYEPSWKMVDWFPKACDLTRQLLEPEPEDRLGYAVFVPTSGNKEGASAAVLPSSVIRQHKWFQVDVPVEGSYPEPPPMEDSDYDSEEEEEEEKEEQEEETKKELELDGTAEMAVAYFEALLNRTAAVPYEPPLDSTLDVSNFEDFSEYQEEHQPFEDDGSDWCNGF